MADMNYTELDWRWAIVLGVALRDGLLDAVADEPRSADEVARELGLDARAVYVLLSALVELGILGENEGKFWMREEHRRPLLEPEHTDYVGGSVVHRCELIGSWGRIGEILKTGKPIEDRTSRRRRHDDLHPIDALRGAPRPRESPRPCSRACRRAPAYSTWGEDQARTPRPSRGRGRGSPSSTGRR
jgi:hypothetical protein